LFFARLTTVHVHVKLDRCLVGDTEVDVPSQQSAHRYHSREAYCKSKYVCLADVRVYEYRIEVKKGIAVLGNSIFSENFSNEIHGYKLLEMLTKYGII